MKEVILLLLLFGRVFIATAQTEKLEMVTDRPDQTEGSVLVPRGGLQVEAGFVYEKDKEDNVEVTNFKYATTLIKYGVNKFLELRFILEFLGERAKVAENPVSKIQGFSPLALGVKIKLVEEKGFRPRAAFIGHITLKSGSEEFNPNYTAADFRFSFAHTLSKKFALSYNLGGEWDGETPQGLFLYTISLGYSITDQLGVFAEGYSFFPEDRKADNRVDAGFTYKISPVVQWDISGGVGLSRGAPDSFLSTGISFRLFK